MICPKCKKKVPEGSNVCGYCGTLLSDEKSLSDETVQLSYEEAMKLKNMHLDNIVEEKDSNDVVDDIAKEAKKNLFQEDNMPKLDSVSVEDKRRLEQAAVPIKSSDMMSLEQLAKKRRPLSTLSFFLTNLVLLVPVVNILLLFVWSFRKQTNQNRQSYARSILIWLGIIILLLAVIVIALLSLGFDFNYMYNQLKEVTYIMSNI